MSTAYKVMMNRTGFGTITLMDMVRDESTANQMARDIMDYFGTDVRCFVVQYEEARHWDNTGKQVNRT